MRCRIIGHAVCAVIHLGDRVLVGTCLLVFNLAEACQGLILGGCRRIGCRHRRVFCYCRKIEGKALCLAPVIEVLGHFDGRLGGCVGVGDDQAVLIVILDGSAQLVGTLLFRDSHNNLMICRIISHAICAAVHLSDCVLVGSCLLIPDLTEACYRISFCSRSCIRCRHRGVFGHCRELEGKAVRLAPVFEFLSGLQFRVCRFIGVGDGQTVCVIILDRSGQLVGGIFCLGHSHDYLMGDRIIGDAVRAAVLLGDRVLVGSGLLVFDLAEACQGRILGCCRCIGCRHRSIFAHCRELEGKAVCLAPVCKLLGRFDRRLGGLVGIGNDQVLIPVICHGRGQLVVFSLDYSYDCFMRCRIIGNAVCAVIHLSNRVLVGSGLVICDAAEYCCRGILGCHGLFLSRHRGILGHCRQVEGKAVCLAPVRKALGGLQGHGCGSKGVGDNQAVLIVILDGSAQLVGAFLLGDGHDCLVRCCVIGDAVYAVVHLGNRVVISSGFLESDLAELGVYGIFGRCCSYDTGLFINARRHRRAVNRFQLEGKALCLAPVVEVLGSLQLCTGRSIGVFDGQAVGIIIFDRCSELVGGIFCLGHSHDYLMGSRIIGNTICAIVLLCDRVFVGSGLLIFDLTEACQGRILSGRCGIGCRHRSLFGHCRELEGKAVCLAPVREILGGFNSRLGRCVGVSDCQTVCAIIRDSCGQLVGSVLCLGHCHDNLMRGCVISDAVRAAVLLGDRVLVGSRLLIFDLAEACQGHILGGYCRIRCRHGSIFSYGCKLEGKAVCLAPVFERLGRFDRCLGGRVSIGDGQAVLIVILDSSAQLVAFTLCYCHDYAVRLRVIGDAIRAIVLLSDRVLVGSRLLIFDLAEACQGRFLGRCCRYDTGLFINARRHRGTLNRFQLEGKAVCLAPGIERLGRLDRRLGGFVGIGDGQAFLIIIFSLCDQFVVLVLCDSHNNLMRGRVVGNTVLAVIGFCDGIFVSTCFLVGNTSELGNCAFFSNGYDLLAFTCSFRHRSILAGSLQCKGEAVCLAPVRETLRRLKLNICGRVLICNSQRICTIIFH